ncbi:hypothetical protein N0V88_005546 [Collariella sp. IMI 366227]|nr:hypothetical protein N0V88_005546 [Collariella sp. IMI 366227]
MSGYKPLPIRHFGDIFIHIDNSNLWIQGQRTYAERKKLDVSSDPTWRFDVGRLRQVLLANSGLKADKKSFNVYVNLYGSTPPPVDTVWEAIASHNVKVCTFERSSWTKREKQVDAELIAESVAQAANAYHSQIPTVFIIVSGDRDVRSAVSRITRKYGCHVHMWSWQNCLAKVYTRPDNEIDPSLFDVHLLDEYLDEVTFHATTFRPERAVINPHSIVVLDPLPSADKVEEFLDRLRTPVYRYEIMPQRPDASSQDLTIIPAFAWTMKPDALRSLFVESKTKLERKGLSVLTYVEYCQKYHQGMGGANKLTLSNRFVEFVKQILVDGDEDDDEEEESEEDEIVDSCEDDDDDDGFKEVNRGSKRRRNWFKKIESTSRMRCNWREYCSRGSDCNYGHTNEEEEYFRVYGSRKAKKTKRCNNPECIKGRTCLFAHSDAELFCPTCGKSGVHAMVDCPERFQASGTAARKV